MPAVQELLMIMHDFPLERINQPLVLMQAGKNNWSVIVY